MFQIELIKPELTYSLRHRILRPNQSFEDCQYTTDYEEGAFHVGAFHQGKLISIASFCLEKHPLISLMKFNIG